MQVRGIFDTSIPYHSGESQSDGVNFFSARGFFELLTNHFAMLSAGMASSASTELDFSGYMRTRPTTLSFSTSATEMCSITRTTSCLAHLAPANPRSSLLCERIRLRPAQFVQAVERRGFVAFRERRIVEHVVDEILDRAFQREDRLPDVKQFASAFADDVHAQQ